MSPTPCIYACVPTLSMEAVLSYIISPSQDGLCSYGLLHLGAWFGSTTSPESKTSLSPASLNAYWLLSRRMLGGKSRSYAPPPAPAAALPAPPRVPFPLGLVPAVTRAPCEPMNRLFRAWDMDRIDCRYASCALSAHGEPGLPKSTRLLVVVLLELDLVLVSRPPVCEPQTCHDADNHYAYQHDPLHDKLCRPGHTENDADADDGVNPGRRVNRLIRSATACAVPFAIVR